MNNLTLLIQSHTNYSAAAPATLISIRLQQRDDESCSVPAIELVTHSAISRPQLQIASGIYELEKESLPRPKFIAYTATYIRRKNENYKQCISSIERLRLVSAARVPQTQFDTKLEQMDQKLAVAFEPLPT